MPPRYTSAKAAIRRWDETIAPESRFADLSIRFCVADGDDAGRLTHGQGGLWDRDMCRYVTSWDRNAKLWTASAPVELSNDPVIRSVSAQALPLVTDLWTRTTLALGGRRSGKSYASAQKVVLYVLRFPGLPGMVLSPTYRQAKNIFNAIRKVVPREWLLPGKLGVKWSNEIKELHFVNGSVVLFRTADNEEGCRSDGVAWLLVDEWQDVGDEAYKNARLSISEGGDDYLVTITATIKPELRRRYEQLKTLEREGGGLARVIRMVSTGNPFIGHALFHEAAKFLDDAMVKQEIEAEWPELVGRIYWPFHADEHVRSFPAPGYTDVTEHVMRERFDLPAPWFVSIDPPHYAACWKIYDDGTMHLVHEILVGADGVAGDVASLAIAIELVCGRAVVVHDPHDHTYDTDLRKYLRQRRQRIVSLRRVAPEYRITAVRRMMQDGKILVDPSCPHAVEVMTRHQYKEGEPGVPDKRQTYERSHRRDSTKIQLVHLADAIGYGVYKLNPAKYDYDNATLEAA